MPHLKKKNLNTNSELKDFILKEEIEKLSQIDPKIIEDQRKESNNQEV